MRVKIHRTAKEGRIARQDERVEILNESLPIVQLLRTEGVNGVTVHMNDGTDRIFQAVK
jgi:hypothetical protein